MKRLFGLCEWDLCVHRWEVTGTFTRRADGREFTQRLCLKHGDMVADASLRHATQVDVWNEEGEHKQMFDPETAARRLAISKGIPVRQARRELERRRAKR
jgi:hypothetical protein